MHKALTLDANDTVVLMFKGARVTITAFELEQVTDRPAASLDISTDNFVRVDGLFEGGKPVPSERMMVDLITVYNYEA